MAGSKYLATVTWEESPHLSKEVQAELLKAIPAYQRDARTKGIPQLGSGAIYPVEESFVVVPDFPIPIHWPRSFGMDVGWNRTAGIWMAKNPDTDKYYFYAEHYRGQAEPSIHAEAFKARGIWIPGFVDPASEGRSQIDGRKLMTIYKGFGLQLSLANNAVESGIYEIWQALSAGNLKVMRSCQNWIQEYRVYRRDQKGHIVKENDHLMDSSRYCFSGRDHMKVKPPPRAPGMLRPPIQAGGWMA